MKRNINNLLKWYLLLAFTLCFTPLTFAENGSQIQDKIISVDFKNETLANVLKELKTKTGYEFLYNLEIINKAPRVTVKAENKPFTEVLTRCLENTGFTYQIIDDTIVIKLKDEKNTTPQNKEISGIVVDENNAPLPGTTIVIKGTQVGAATDKDGKFKLTLPNIKDITLVVSFLGFETQEIKVTDQKEIRIVLQEKKESLEDVVVTGYANVKKSSFTGTAIRVEKKDLLKVASRNVIAALQVFDPSLRIMKNNDMGSDPNTVPEFYIRGRSGVGVMELDKNSVSRTALQNNPNSPLFIMDGYEVKIDKVYDFDPNRIANITILKDAAATALYGSRAANGVIVIETVAPQPGQLRVSYDFTGELTVPDISDYNLMNASEKLEAERLAGFYESDSPVGYQSLQKEYVDKMNNIMAGVNTDWISLPLRNPFNHKHSLFIEGGSNDFRFGITMRYDEQNGVMKESGRTRTGTSFMLDYRVKNLQLRNEVSYDVTKGKNSPYGDFSEYTRRLPYVSYKDIDGNYVHDLIWHKNETRLNPYYEAKLMKSFSNNNYSSLTDNLGVNWYISEALQMKAQFSITKTDEWSSIFVDPESATFKSNDEDLSVLKGTLDKSDAETINWNFKAFANYVKTIGNHNINFSAGVELNESKYSFTSTTYRGFPSGELSSPMYAEKSDAPTFSDNHTRLSSVYAALNYSFQDIYLLDASYRMDGSSEFGVDNKTASFYAVGAGVNFHKYGFMQGLEKISQLRLTGTYGQTGKVNFPAYAAKHTYQISDKYYGTGNGLTLFYMGNDNLTWEKTNELNIRFVLGLLNDNITLEADWYNKLTKDLITDVTIPVSTGFESYKDNLGEVRNRGYELILRANVYKTQKWDVILYGNVAHNKNRIMKISESLKAYNSRVDEEFGKFKDAKQDLAFAKPLMKYEEGGSLTSIWGMKSMGINPSDGKEVFINRDGTISYDWVSSQQQILGDTEPDAQGSFGVNLRYKNFSLFASFMYEFGAQAYNTTLVEKVECVDLRYQNADKRVLTQRWESAGQRTPLKDIRDRRETTRPTSRFVQDYNALDFTSLSLSYDFDREVIRRFGLSMLRLQFQMGDVAHISNVKQERGLSYPFSRTFNFSLNATF